MAVIVRSKIKVSGRLSSNGAREGSPGACERLSVLVFSQVKALHLRKQNPTVIHGKEKVYGSIP